MIVAGVMTGTSVDGIDVAIVEFKSETDWKLIDAKEKVLIFDWRSWWQIVTEDRGYDFHQSVGHGSGFGQNGHDDQNSQDFIRFHGKISTRKILFWFIITINTLEVFHNHKLLQKSKSI